MSPILLKLFLPEYLYISLMCEKFQQDWRNYIFEAREKITDSITASLNHELQKFNVSNLAETVPT
jgi:hypothetical protein